MPRKSLKTIAEAMNAKMECLWKPAQSGKTRTIQQIIREDEGKHAHLNILICSNNRLLVAQTNARMTDDLYGDSGSERSSVDEEDPADDRIEGGVYSWMSGTKKTNISVDALAWKVFRGEVSMIVCCAHKARFRMLNRLLAELEGAPFSKPVNVWIDEADVSVKHWSGEFDFTRFRCVRKVMLVSATFDAVFDHYARIRVMPFPETHPECYLGLRDCDLQPFDAEVRGSHAYLDAVLTAHPEMVARGMKLFVPGDIERVSHTAIADSLLARGCTVLVLNGETKAFLFPDGRRLDIELTLDESNPTELSRVLAEVYARENLASAPFAVTGQLCLGRGITFQSESFTFDYAVVPGMKDAASAYQCVARVLGNVRTFSPWTPVVYMNSALLAAVLRQERIATNLARLVHENEWADVGKEEVERASFDSEAEYEAARELADKQSYKDEDYEAVWTREFTSLEELKAAKATHGRMPEAGPDGFYKNANGGKGPMSRAQLNALKAGKKTTNMRLPLEKVGDSTKRTYPFYEDPKDASTLRFVVRTLTRIR